MMSDERDQNADSFDPVYFWDGTWSDRVQKWRDAAHQQFSTGNFHVVETSISDPESGLRVVVNIGVHALVKLLTDGRYLNLYERPEIGGERREPSRDRQTVDLSMGLDGKTVYFGAVALGGAGVRYYGEYCMVLMLDRIDPDPQLFDRDSYDTLLEPFAGREDAADLIAGLLGKWQPDVKAMVLMKVLPEVVHQRRLVTTGTVSDVVLKDQEFIEVHLQPDQSRGPRSFGPDELEEIRESPDEVAVSTRLREREADGLTMSAVEHEWLVRREVVTRMLGQSQVATRVVTQHGRGYQWK